MRTFKSTYFEALPAFPSTKLPTSTGRPDLNMLSLRMRHRPWPGLRWSTESANLSRVRVTQFSINVQSMFIDVLCELPFVRVLVTQAVMFNAMLCELLFVRVLHVAI